MEKNRIERVAIVNDKIFRIGNVIHVRLRSTGNGFGESKEFIGKLINFRFNDGNDEIMLDCSANFESKIIPVRLSSIKSATIHTGVNDAK